MNSYLKEENIIGCIDLNDNNEIRSNTLAQLKRFKKNISGKIEVILKKNPYLAAESLSVYTLMNDIMIQSISKIVN